MRPPWTVPNYSQRTQAAMPQGQGMLKPLRTLGELKADYALADSDMAWAEKLLSTEYVPNSGAMGALAMMFNAYQGRKGKEAASKRISEILREESDLMSAAERQKLEDQAKADEAKFQRDLEKIAFTEKTKAQNRAPARPQFSGGLIFDPNTGEVTKTPFYREPQGAGQQPPEDIRKLQAYLQLPPDQRAEYDRLFGRGGGTAPAGYRQTADGNLEPIPGGPADPSRKTEGPKQLTAEAASKLSLLENAKREAEAYLQAVSPSEGQFEDIAARMPENSRRLESALRAKLRAESGASISGEEIAGEMGRYGPSITSADQTNAAAARRLIEDLDNQMRALTGSAGGDVPAGISGGADATQFQGFTIRRKR